MKTLDRYVAFTFVRSYAILLLVGVGMYVLLDLLINLDEFTENRALSPVEVLAVMGDYYGYNLPLYFSQLSGPIMAFAGAFTIAMMLRNNEMTTLVAAGMPLQRLAVPILVSSAFFVAAWMLNREFVLPRFAHKIARHHDDLTGERTEGIWFARDANDAMLTARRINLAEGRLDYVKIVEPGPRGGLIEADAAVYHARERTWYLERGERILVMGGPGDSKRGIVRETVTEYPFALLPEELLLQQSSQWAGMLSLRQMNTLLKGRHLPNLAAVRMQRHIWLTQPVLQWLLLVLVLPFFLTREPESVLVVGGKALLVAIAFYGVVFLSHAIISAEWAALVAWIPILLFGPVAVLQLANVKT